VTAAKQFSLPGTPGLRRFQEGGFRWNCGCL